MTFCQHSSRGSCPEYVAVNQVKAVLASCLYGFGASTAQVAHCFDEVDHLQKFAAVPMFAQEAESKFPYGQDAGTDMKLSQLDPHTHGGTITPPKAAADSRDSQLIANGVDIGTALHPDSGDVRPSRCFSAPPRELCRRYKRAGFCKYGDRCFYRHDVSQCKRFESNPASPPPDVVSFGATCIVPDFTASIPMSNAPTPMFYNISTESEPKTPTSRSSVGDSLPAVPFFPDFHTSEEDAYNATSAAIDVEEAPRAQTIDEESLSSSSLFDGTNPTPVGGGAGRFSCEVDENDAIDILDNDAFLKALELMFEERNQRIIGALRKHTSEMGRDNAVVKSESCARDG